MINIYASHSFKISDLDEAWHWFKQEKSRENRPPAYVPTSYVCQFQTLKSLSSLLNAPLAPMVSS